MRLLLTALAAALVLSACRKSDPAPGDEAAPGNTQVTEAAAAPAAPLEFHPPADGMLTAPQVRKFLLAHQALMKINEMYLDRPAGAGDGAALTGALDLAREKAARKFGLAGYAEYKWILEEAPRHPGNAPLLRQMKIEIVGG